MYNYQAGDLVTYLSYSGRNATHGLVVSVEGTIVTLMLYEDILHDIYLSGDLPQGEPTWRIQIAEPKNVKIV